MKLFAFVLLACVLTASVGTVRAGTIIQLPDPPIVDGIPVALKYDDFLSYSALLMAEIQNKVPSALPIGTFGDYDKFVKGTGTGVLDVKVGTGGDKANSDVLGQGIDFADAFDLPVGDVEESLVLCSNSNLGLGRSDFRIDAL